MDAVQPEVLPSVPLDGGTTHQSHGARCNSGVESLVQFYERLSQNVSLSESNKSKPYMRKSTASAHYDFTPQPLQLTPSEPSVEQSDIQPQLDKLGSSRNLAIANVHGEGGLDYCQMDDRLRRTSHGGFENGFGVASSSMQSESAAEHLADAQDREDETLLSQMVRRAKELSVAAEQHRNRIRALCTDRKQLPRDEGLDDLQKSVGNAVPQAIPKSQESYTAVTSQSSERESKRLRVPAFPDMDKVCKESEELTRKAMELLKRNPKAAKTVLNALFRNPSGNTGNGAVPPSNA